MYPTHNLRPNNHATPTPPHGKQQPRNHAETPIPKPRRHADADLTASPPTANMKHNPNTIYHDPHYPSYQYYTNIIPS
jgi:hypothetical protein